jgi:hypothetical protein
MKPHEINSHPYFIKGWYLEDDELIDSLIQTHKDSPNKKQGEIILTDSGQAEINPERKDSIDVKLSENLNAQGKYYDHLNDCIKSYAKEFQFCPMNKTGIIQDVMLQYYPIGGGYHEWHYERGGVYLPASTRHLVFMTYLNTIEEPDFGGGTAFFYQDLAIQAERGLTLVWVSDWTHTHRGLASKTSEKYIATGWTNFI